MLNDGYFHFQATKIQPFVDLVKIYPYLCLLNNLENPGSPANLYHPGLLVETKPPAPHGRLHHAPPLARCRHQGTLPRVARPGREGTAPRSRPAIRVKRDVLLYFAEVSVVIRNPLSHNILTTDTPQWGCRSHFLNGITQNHERISFVQ